MTRYRIPVFIATAILVSFVVACAAGGNSGSSAVQTTDSVAQSVSLTVAAITVAQTVAALTDFTATPLPSGISPQVAVQEPAEQLVSNAPLTDLDTDTPLTESLATCATITGVNIRSGPGTIYEPTVGTLPGGAAMVPISYVGQGFPEGQWLEMRIAGTGQIAWVTAGTQFIRCTIELTSLPAPVVIPATPEPTLTPTPLAVTAIPTRVVAGLPPNVTNDIPSGACELTQHIISICQQDPDHLFRVFARDDRVGGNDGDGIDYVRFTIFDESGQVYQQTEHHASYCVFQGGDPDCRNWPYDDFGRYTWGQGGPIVNAGTYEVFIEVVSNVADPNTESNVCNWSFDMTIALP